MAKGVKLSFTASATDPDAGQTTTFSLMSAPSGASISSTSGSFSWTPSATGSYTFKVKATDNGSPVKYDEDQITVTARPVNTMEAANQPGNMISVKASISPNPVQ